MRLTVITILLTFGGSTPYAEAQSDADATSVVGSRSLHQDFPDSAPPFADESLARVLERIDAALKLGDADQVVKASQEFLDGTAGVVPLAGNEGLKSFSDEVLRTDRTTSGSVYARYGPLRGAVERLQRSLDEDGWEAYLLAADAKAERLWEDFRRTRNVSKLRMLVSRYFNSSRGDDAAVLLAALALDRGEPVEAYSLLERVRSEHPRPDVDSQLLRIRSLVAASRLGDVEEVRVQWARMERDGLTKRIPARVRRELEQGVSDERLAHRELTAWASGAGTSDGRRLASRIDDSKALDDRVTEAWTVPLEAGGDARLFDSTDIVPGWTELKRTPTANVVASSGRVFVSGRQGIVCSDAETGRILWRGRRSSPPVEPMLSTFGAMRAKLGGPRGERSREPTGEEIRWFSDRISTEFAVHGDRLFAIENVVDFGRNAAPPTRTRRRVRVNLLAVYEASTGRPLWRRRADEAKSVRSEAGFLGAPASHDELVLAPASFAGEVWLLGLDRDTGETRWRTFVCDEPAGGASFWSPTRVVVTGNSAYVLPGTGLVACLDATTGDARWAVRYQRSLSLNLSREERTKNRVPTFDFLGWERGTLLVAGRFLIVAPSDTERMFALDRRNGALVWEANAQPLPKSSTDIVLGATDDQLLVAGHDVLRQYRITDGELVWETPLAGATGQGLVTPDAVYVPVGSTLGVFDLATGERRRSIEFLSGYGKPLGNLATDGQRLFAAGATRAFSLTPLDEGLAMLADRINGGVTRRRLDRAALLIGLGRDDEAFDDLTAAAKTVRDPVGEDATTARILGALTQPAFDEERPQRVLRAIVEGGLARVPGLKGAETRVLRESWRSVARDCLASILAKELTGTAEEILTVAALTNDVGIRNLAERALIGTMTAADLPTLDAVLESTPAVRTIAVHALSSKRLIDVDGVGERLDVFWSSDDPLLRLTSTESLLARGDRRAFDRLVTLLESDDVNVRVRAAGRLWAATGQRLAFDPRARSDKRTPQVAAWRKWVDAFGAKAEIRPTFGFARTWGRTLVAIELIGSDDGDGVVEYDLDGNQTWRVDLKAPNVCWATENGERVVGSNNVTIVYAAGDGPPRELFRLGGKRVHENPRLTGEMLAWSGPDWVGEYDLAGRKVWEARVVWKAKPRKPLRVAPLSNGNIQVDFRVSQKGGAVVADTAIELDRRGNVVRQMPFDLVTILHVLPSGNALVRPDPMGGRRGNTVEERDRMGNVLWSFRTARGAVSSAQRLANGNTLVGVGGDGPKEIRPDGTVAWELRVKGARTVYRY